MFARTPSHRSAQSFSRACRPRIFVILALVAVAAFAALGAGGCKAWGGGAAKQAKAAPKQLYHCPMHPEIVSDKPGDCPICGMRLVPIPAASPAPATIASAQPTPGAAGGLGTAPVGARGQAPTGEMPGMPGMAESPSRPPGGPLPPVLDLGVDRARLAGVRSAEATPGTLTRTVRAVGTVAIDETRVRQITTKIGGFIEKLYVNATGQAVRAGTPLFEIYSPELLATQQEYLRARRSAVEFERSTLPEVRRGGAELAEAARRRLELLDVPEDFLTRLDASGQAQRTIVFDAPFGGVVTAKNIVAGQRIEPGMDLLTVTDLSHVWVIAQIYEAETAAARVGRAARVTLPYNPAVALSGRVGLVYPTLDTDTRTLKLRLEFANPRGVLKPGMFVTVDLGVDTATGVVIPDSAVIDTGARQVVFVETAPGRFALREVTLALRADGRAVVRSGLAAGERVAVSAIFLLDSESRLRDATGRGGEPNEDH
jgi:RND family efflux transporter MFP subunit